MASWKASLAKQIAEGLGAFAIVFFGCGAIAFGIESFVPIVFGATVAVMIYATGHISGAHFNPAVTIGFAFVGRFRWRDVPQYVLAQLIGAIIAAMVVRWLAGPTPHLGQTLLAVDVLRGFVVEALLTFFLMLTIVSVATDRRASHSLAGLAIGLAVMIGAFLGGSMTGASMNPARSLGPAIASGQLTDIWVYFAAPCVGACLAAFTYEQIRGERGGTDQR